jgi:hypothetical protein
MAPTTPVSKPKRHEYNTLKRTHFFHAFDSKENEQGVGAIAHLPAISIPTSIARRWLQEREVLGEAAFRSQRKAGSTISRPSKESASDLHRLTNQNEPIYEKGWQEQAVSSHKSPHYAPYNAMRIEQVQNDTRSHTRSKLERRIDFSATSTVTSTRKILLPASGIGFGSPTKPISSQLSYHSHQNTSYAM